MKYLKIGWNPFYVLLMLFIKSSLEQGFTPFGLLGFGGRPPLFQGFGPPPPGVQTFLPPPLGFPGFPGPPPLPIVSPPLTAFGGTGSLTLPSESAPPTFDLSGFSNSVQTLPATGDTSSIVQQSGFDGGLLTLGESTSTLDNQNLITSLTGQDALLGGTVTSITNGLATGVITSDAGVPDGVNPASAAETSFVSRFSNDGGSSQTTANGQLNSFDSVPGTSQQTFDASAILNTVFGNSNADASSSRVSSSRTENSPNRVLLTRGVSNNASPSNLIQRQTISVQNTGEGIPTMNELQQMFTPTELTNNIPESANVNGIGIQSSITASGGGVSLSGSRQVSTDPSGRNDRTRGVNMNPITSVNQITDDRNPSQINTPVDELSMDFRNFIRADGGQTDPSDILSRFPQSSGTVFTTSNERMVMPSNTVFSQSIDGPNPGSQIITETEVRTRTNTRTGTQNGLITPSFATDPGIVFDNTASSGLVGRGMNQDAITISRNGNNFEANRESDPAKKTSLVINDNSNIVGSKVDVQNSDTRFIDMPQSVDLKRSEFKNTRSTMRTNLEPAEVSANSISKRFDPRTESATNVTRQNKIIQDPVLDSQRRSKIMFVDGNNSDNDNSFLLDPTFSVDQNSQNNAMIANRDPSGVNFNTNFPSRSTRPGVNINFNFPVKQPEVDIGASLNAITSDIGTQQRFQLTSKVPSRNIEDSDPSTIDIADPSRIPTGMNPKTIQTMGNLQRPGMDSNALPSGNFTNKFIKRTTTVKRISNPEEDGSGTVSQTIDTRFADPSNTMFFASSGINGMDSTFNRNVQPFVGDQATFNRFVSSSNSTGFTGDPQIMGVQNSLQTNRFSPSVLPGNTGNPGTFFGALGSSNGVNSRSAMPTFASASNTNTGGGVSRTMQAQNTPSAIRFVSSSNSTGFTRDPQIMGVQNSLQTNRFSPSVLPGNTGNPGTFLGALDSSNGVNSRSSVPMFASASNTNTGGGVSRTMRAQNTPSTNGFSNRNAAADPSSMQAQNMPSAIRFVSSSNSTGFTRDPQIMGVQNSLQTNRFSPSVLPGNTGNPGTFFGALDSSNGVNSRSAMPRFASVSNTNTGGGVSRTMQAQNTPSTNGFSNSNAAADPSSANNQFVSSDSGNVVRSLQSVQGSNFESSGFSRGSRQNSRIGGFVSMNDGGSSGTSQDPQRSISNILGGTSSVRSEFQTGTTTGNNFGIRARTPTNFSEAGINAVSRNADPNAVTIIETSRNNVVLSSNPESNGDGDVNIVVQGTTLPPVNVLNDTTSCKTSTDCRAGEQCTYNRNFLCPDWVDSIICQCLPGCTTSNVFIPLGSKVTIDNCGNECICTGNNGVASCSQRTCQ